MILQALSRLIALKILDTMDRMHGVLLDNIRQLQYMGEKKKNCSQ